MKKTFILFFLLVLNLIYLVHAAAPQLPMTISGDVAINEKPAKAGIEITAKINGKVVKSYNLPQDGYYAIPLQNAEPNDVVVMYVKGIKAAETTFDYGKVEKLNLDVKDMAGLYYAGGISLLIILAVIIFFFIRRNKKTKKT